MPHRGSDNLSHQLLSPVLPRHAITGRLLTLCWRARCCQARNDALPHVESINRHLVRKTVGLALLVLRPATGSSIVSCMEVLPAL
jgi:hypothetical protein